MIFSLALLGVAPQPLNILPLYKNEQEQIKRRKMRKRDEKEWARKKSFIQQIILAHRKERKKEVHSESN